MAEQVLNHKKYTIYICFSGYCDSVTFERVSNGESFTLYGELYFCPYTGRLIKIIPDDYDGCFDFDRDEVKSILNEFNIDIDYSQLY